MRLLSPCYSTILQATLLEMKSNSNKQTTFSSHKATVVHKRPASIAKILGMGGRWEGWYEHSRAFFD